MTRARSHLGWILLPLGLLLLGGAGWAARRVSAFVDRAVEAQGTVIRLASNGSKRAPVVEFAGPSGEPRQLTHNVYSRPPAYAVGQRVSVLYDPDDPGDARLRTGAIWVLPLVLACAGALALALGGAPLIAGASRRRLPGTARE